MMQKSSWLHCLLVLSLVSLLLISCNVDFVEAGKAGRIGEQGMENVNWYIVPYIHYALNEDHTGYIATVAEGARLASVSIPGVIYTQWGDMPVKEFGGFESNADEDALKELHLGRYEDSQTGTSVTVKVNDDTLQYATALEAITTSNPKEETPRWGYLPTLEKEGYHFHGWYAGGEKVYEGMSITDENVKAGAVFESLVHREAVEPTCTEEGNIGYWECSGCHLTFSDNTALNIVNTVVVPANGHTKPLLFHAVVEPTCQTQGNVAYYSCDACGALFSDAEGTHSITEITLQKVDHQAGLENKCNELEHWKECVWCSVEMEKEEHVWGEWGVDISATEHTKGSRHHVCTVCGLRKDEDIPEHDHIPGEVVEKIDATCTTGAYYLERCGNPLCGEVVRFDIPEEPAKGHQGTLIPFRDSTCLEEGVVQHFHCDVCEKDYPNRSSAEPMEENLVIARKDHQWSNVWTASEDTHYHLCTLCGVTRTDESEHVYDQAIADAKYLKKTATCQEGNTYYMSCICGRAGTETFKDNHTASHNYTKYKAIDQNNHQKVCEWCGTAEPNSMEAHSFVADGAGKKCSLCGYTVSGASGGFNVIVVDNTPKGHLELVSHVGTIWTFKFVNDKTSSPPTKLEWYVEGALKRTDLVEGVSTYDDFSFEAKYPMTYKLFLRYSNGDGSGSETKVVTGGNR